MTDLCTLMISVSYANPVHVYHCYARVLISDQSTHVVQTCAENRKYSYELEYLGLGYIGAPISELGINPCWLCRYTKQSVQIGLSECTTCCMRTVKRLTSFLQLSPER